MNWTKKKKRPGNLKKKKKDQQENNKIETQRGKKKRTKNFAASECCGKNKSNSVYKCNWSPRRGKRELR